MKFPICRTSHRYNASEAPCAGAYKEGDRWYVDISTLEELLALIDNLTPRHSDNEVILNIDREIEIYDDYRE